MSNGDRPRRGLRFWVLSILSAAFFIVLFESARRLGGGFFGAVFARVVLVAVVLAVALWQWRRER